MKIINTSRVIKVYSLIIGIAFFSKNLPLRHLENHFLKKKNPSQSAFSGSYLHPWGINQIRTQIQIPDEGNGWVGWMSTRCKGGRITYPTPKREKVEKSSIQKCCVLVTGGYVIVPRRVSFFFRDHGILPNNALLFSGYPSKLPYIVWFNENGSHLMTDFL